MTTAGEPAATGGVGPATIGVDLGTSAVKVVAIDGSGSVLARSRRAYPTHHPEPGAAEQVPDDWWRALDDALAELRAALPSATWATGVAAIGLSAMLPTLVATDASGAALGPAITWQDGRAEPEAEVLREAVGDAVLYARTGQRVDGRYLLPMMTRLTRLDPRAAGATHVSGAKDHLFARLTGELLTDPSTAAGFGCFDIGAGRWDGTSQWHLPTVAPSTTARPLLARWAERWGLPAGLPVILGAADSVLGAHALGVREPGQVGYLAGTSTVVLGPLATPVPDPRERYLLTPMATSGFGAEMDLLATGSAQAWWARMLGLPGPAALDEQVDDAPRDGAAPVFLPYVAPGEQGALWDPELSGALVGLTLRHTTADLAQALLTGLVVESARCVEVLTAIAPVGGAAPGELRAGGGAVGPRFAQQLADATGRAVRISPHEPDQSAIGAAWLAAAAAGVVDLADERPEPGAQRLEPRAGHAHRWAERADLHDRLRLVLFDRAATQEDTR